MILRDKGKAVQSSIDEYDDISKHGCSILEKACLKDVKCVCNNCLLLTVHKVHVSNLIIHAVLLEIHPFVMHCQTEAKFLVICAIVLQHAHNKNNLKE